MADLRVKDLATTASTVSSDDYIVVDGDTNGTRKFAIKNVTDQVSAATSDISDINDDLTTLTAAINECITCTDADGDGNIVITLVSV